MALHVPVPPGIKPLRDKQNLSMPEPRYIVFCGRSRLINADLYNVFIESGGDDLSATFSPELTNLMIYVIDVDEGENIPRKGGPGINRSPIVATQLRG